MGISPAGPLDLERRSIDGGDRPVIEPLADERDGGPVAAADLEQALVGPGAEQPDRRLDSSGSLGQRYGGHGGITTPSVGTPPSKASLRPRNAPGPATVGS